MIKSIFILIIGLIYGASFGIMWCTHQLKKQRKKEVEISGIIIDVEGVKKQAEEEDKK